MVGLTDKVETGDNGETASEPHICRLNGSLSDKSMEEILFDILKEEDNGIYLDTFLEELHDTGLQDDDPRLREMMRNFSKIDLRHTNKLDCKTFKECIRENIKILTRAFKNEFKISNFPKFCETIEELYHICAKNKDGHNADYIPQLAKANPDSWGVSVCTIDGQRYSKGDTITPFTIQSGSKPFSYAIAASDLGSSYVHQFVGQEPSGRLFNEITLDHKNRPHNPMINAGAMMIAGLIKPGLHPSHRFDFLLNKYIQICGNHGHIGFNNSVYLSEKNTAWRNTALAYFMKEYNSFPQDTDIKAMMELYFQACSIEVNCESAAVMAATLANGGICPLTEEKVLESETVRDTLSLMFSCGMYDYSGQFAFKVGLPGKSGVAGLVLLVVPNVCGIACWSPPLDAKGNSVRGVQFCESLVGKFPFHNYNCLVGPSTAQDEPRVRLYELQGQQVVSTLFAASNGDLTAFRQFLLKGMDLTICDYDKRTPLHLAAAEGHLAIVKFLLEKAGVPHNPKDRWDNTPLSEARSFGHTEVVEFIEKHAAEMSGPQKAYLPFNNLRDKVSFGN